MDKIPYSIERTRNKTSRASFSGNEILIRLAGNLTTLEEERHIHSLLRKMSRKFASYHASPLIDPFADLLKGSGKARFTLLQDIDYELSVEAGKRTKAIKTPHGWSVTRSQDMPENRFHRFLWKLLSASFAKRIEEMVHRINEKTYRANVSSVRLRYMRARFGSCGRRGQIALNTALLFVPAPLLEYVIVHELAHLRHPNHSSSYWETVKRAIPDFAERAEELKRHRLPQV